MKTRSFLTHLLVGTTLLCTAVLPAAAQQGGGGGRGGAMGGMLTPEQRTKMREATQSEMAPLTEKLVAAQKEAVKAALAATPDEKVVREKVNAVGKIQTDIAVLRLKGVKEIASTLTAEQKTQMEENPGMAYNMLFGSMMMGGGGRRGGGGGGGNN